MKAFETNTEINFRRVLTLGARHLGLTLLISTRAYQICQSSMNPYRLKQKMKSIQVSVRLRALSMLKD